MNFLEISTKIKQMLSQYLEGAHDKSMHITSTIYKNLSSLGCAYKRNVMQVEKAWESDWSWWETSTLATEGEDGEAEMRKALERE